MRMIVHLTKKNVWIWIAGICALALAGIAVLVPSDHWGLPPWKRVLYILVLLAVIGLTTQLFVQSREDDERNAREQERDRRQENIERGIAALSQQLTKPAITETSIALNPSPSHDRGDIHGEVYRLVMSPRSVAWPLLRDLYRIRGREDEAVVDTDILVEMYLVNQSQDRTHYIRDLKLSAVVNGNKVEFKAQNDLRTDPFLEQEYEYGLEEKNVSGVEPLKRLYDRWPLALSPRQPVEGWVRFMATEVNADKIEQGTITLTAVDSL